MKLLNSFFLLATFIFLFSCSNNNTQNIEIKGNAMGTFYFIKMIDVPNKLEKDKLKLELNETFLEINDTLETPALEAISYIHFHPEILIMSSSSNTLVTNRGEINCSGHSHMEISDYGYSDEFNKEVSAKVLLIYFSQSLITKFIF